MPYIKNSLITLRRCIADGSATTQQVLRILDELIEEQGTPEMNVGKWISTKDRLPDNEQDVLAYLDDGEETRIAPCNYSNGVWFDCIMNCVVVLDHVTHWMQLPEPPKGGRA